MRDQLKIRAEHLARVRAFFSERDVLEVDTNLLRKCPAIDATIDPIKTSHGYLVTSPEYAMKTLLSEGAGDIYQLSHVFRAEENGPWHSNEFSMIEYYRLGMSFSAFIDEVAELIQLFTGPLPVRRLTYHEALDLYPGPAVPPDPSWDADTALNYRFAHIEEYLGQGELTVITDYPASQAALARVEKTAQRFEFYYRSIELCNGYDEVTQASEVRSRLLAQNALRNEPLPVDEDFLNALDLPPCCGVALGFDRLLALHQNSQTIHMQKSLALA
ncbi:MAG: EF-P lysine aminoacylase GenX [Chlamydiales bacterium]|nr:EF-P lysine aminoacylase GenX [Chlamydiales bacterium]